MPGNRHRKNKNNQFHHQNGGGIQKPHSYSNNNGGGSNRNNKHFGNSKNRKIYFNPSIISTIEDEEYDRNTYNNSNSNGNRNEHKKSNKDRRNMLDKFKDMGAKPKLSIGDTDNDVKKALLESKSHCQLSNLPKDVFDLIVNYVQNYFTCFDTKRDDLLGAYNPKCTFSLALNMANNQISRHYKFDDGLLRENRNLKRIVGNEEHHREKRFRLQHTGYIDTLSVLTKMPATEHDPRSFKLDVSFFSPHMITFSLAGVFKEGKPSDKVRPLRSFHRVFVCIPDPNSQMTIVNEQFTISNITHEQYKIYYDNVPKQEKISVETNQAQTTTTTVNTEAVSEPALLGLTGQQIQMVKDFSINSRLNLDWSKYCLEHVSWNFDEAAKAFVQFKESIPKEAFLV